MEQFAVLHVVCICEELEILTVNVTPPRRMVVVIPVSARRADRRGYVAVWRVRGVQSIRCTRRPPPARVKITSSTRAAASVIVHRHFISRRADSVFCRENKGRHHESCYRLRYITAAGDQTLLKVGYLAYAIYRPGAGERCRLHHRTTSSDECNHVQDARPRICEVGKPPPASPGTGVKV